MPEPETTPPAQLRCVCGDPVERWTGPGEPGWVHSPGSDTTCVDARPRCPHCGLPHDLDPAGLPARVCAMARTPEYQASIKAIPPDYQPAPAEPVPGLRDQIAGVFRVVDGEAPAWTKRDAGPEAHVDAVMAVVQPVIDKAQQRAEAMERAMEDTAADALKHRGCHRSLMGQVQRAETAEAALARVRDLHDRLTASDGLTDPEDAITRAAAARRIAAALDGYTPPVPADQPEGGVG